MTHTHLTRRLLVAATVTMIANTAEAQSMTSNEVSNVAPLQWGKSGETTYCGALTAAAQAMGVKTDYVTLMGDTSLAFRMRWWRKDGGAGWCPSSPVGEMTPWTHRAEPTVGYKITFNVDFDEKADFGQYAGRIKQAIDAGRPVLAYGDTFDMAVIYGYAEDGRVVRFRDYFKGDKPHEMELAKTKGLVGFFDEKVAIASPRDRAMTALRNAVADWKLGPDRTNNPKGGGAYHFGEAAYAKWIDDLKDAGKLTADERKQLFQPSWWTFCVLVDARATAAKYLRQIAPHFEGNAAAALDRAAVAYEKSSQAGGRAFAEKDVFLGPWSGQTIDLWSDDVRAEEADRLETMRDYDKTAIAEIEKALAAIK